MTKTSPSPASAGAPAASLLKPCELQIHRVTSNMTGDKMQIVAKVGSARVVSIEVSLEDFAKAVTGMVVPASATTF